MGCCEPGESGRDSVQQVGLCTAGRNGQDTVRQVGVDGYLNNRWEWVGNNNGWDAV